MADGGTSNPNPNGKTSAADCSLAVKSNANVQNFDTNPGVFNASPATKKSYPPK